jgi:hypothetical protein
VWLCWHVSSTSLTQHHVSNSTAAASSNLLQSSLCRTREFPLQLSSEPGDYLVEGNAHMPECAATALGAPSAVQQLVGVFSQTSARMLQSR